jgi:hypothetical protein
MSAHGKELRAMGITEQEQAEAMKRYIRKEVVIPITLRFSTKGCQQKMLSFTEKYISVGTGQTMS